MGKSNPKMTQLARNLRKNMTKEERKLWYCFFKEMKIHAHRQKAIGPYIVDFYVASAKLVIELDGSQHFEEKGQRSDAIRDAYLISLGMTVVRYSNTDINRNFQDVCNDILRRLHLLEE